MMSARTRSFLKFFYWRQALIPLSTVINSYVEGTLSPHSYNYYSVYGFGFRICCFHYIPK